MNGPLLFPCAARVKVPQLGSEDSDLKYTKKHRQEQAAIVFPTSWPHQPSSQAKVNLLTNNLTFSEDVVKDRCFHMLPYDEKYMYEAFDATGLVPFPPRTKYPVGRHNPRGPDIRHMPCALRFTKPKLKPMKKKVMEKALKMHIEAVKENEVKVNKKVEEVVEGKASEESVEARESSSTVFLTEVKSEIEVAKPKITEEPEESKQEWDAYLMSLISSTTANHLVHNKMQIGEAKEKEKLTKLLEGWYGIPEHTELIQDDMSDGELDNAEAEKAKPKKKWTKRETSVLAEVLQINDSKHSFDPYSDDNKAPFYRQPAGLRRLKKHEEKEEAGAINATAHDIEVKSYKPSPPPTLRDFVNPSVGEKLFDTDNMFEQEWLAGTSQIHQQTEDQSKIVMTSQNRYKKQLQMELPEEPDKWFPKESDRTPGLAKTKKPEKGLRRWQNLPKPIDDTAEILKVVPPGMDLEMHRTPDFDARKRAKNNAALMQIVNEWRSKWHLTGQFEDSNPDDLIRDMSDIQAHVRLKAVATIGKAAEYHPPVDPGIQLEYQAKLNDQITQISPRLFMALECMLEDSCDKVRKAAAITLFSLNKPSDKASDILREALESETQIDRWAAAQCLAHFEICDSRVIGEIIEQLLCTEDSLKHECASVLLARLSVSTNLVHCMVAEQLNSCSWRHKVMACKVLPTLHGTINKDITNKLADLMWNDWHEEVRKAAAQSLGKTGHGRYVHDDLKERLSTGNEKIRLDALSKIGHLGIMTAKLLPAFLVCFDDEYVSIRSEVCITSGNLRIKDEMVTAKLIHLATFDPLWKIKALAFQALGQTGIVTEQIQDCLLWAVRYEEKPGVRAEACHSLMELNMKNEEVADVLQDRFLVESSQLVRDELARALSAMFDISATEDMDMVAQIKGEVRKLCKRNLIATQIVLNEMDEEKQRSMDRLIYESQQEIKRLFRVRNLFRNVTTPSQMDSRQSFFNRSLYEYKKERELNKKSMMDRIRSLSQSGTPTSTPKPKPVISSSSSSPEPSREGTLFTPTADDELAAILSVDVSSGRETPDTSVVGSKSGMGTQTPSMVSPIDDLSDVESTHVKSHMKRIKEVEDEVMSQLSMSIAGAETEEDELEELEEESSKDVKDSKDAAERLSDTGLGSTVKFSSQLMVAEVPGRSSSVGLSVSKLDMAKSPMVSSMGFSAEMRAMFSREALMEREKVNTDAKNSFYGLDHRYKDIAEDLFKLDNSYLESCETPDQIGEEVKNITFVSIQTPDKLVRDYDECFPIEDDDSVGNSDSSERPSSTKKDSNIEPSVSVDTVQEDGRVKPTDTKLEAIPSIVVVSPPESKSQFSEQDITRDNGIEAVVEKLTEINSSLVAEDSNMGRKSPIDIIITAVSDSSSSSSEPEYVPDTETH